MIEQVVGTTVYANSSRIIHKGPCIVKAVHIGADGGNVDCQIYDGEGTGGQQKAHIEVKNGESYLWLPGGGTDFDYGIYLAVSSSNTKCSITFIPESRKEFI